MFNILKIEMLNTTTLLTFYELINQIEGVLELRNHLTIISSYLLKKVSKTKKKKRRMDIYIYIVAT